ncbi:MAG TPA: hypothetical protein VE153_11325, partial [Myxococcus sp.]|nr:hypothetical protein [Myxococcus sp.]
MTSLAAEDWGRSPPGMEGAAGPPSGAPGDAEGVTGRALEGAGEATRGGALEGAMGRAPEGAADAGASAAERASS